MTPPPDADRLVNILRDAVATLVRADSPDLTFRQLAIFLTCYLYDGDHTVRGLAADLRVPKPSVSRSLDRLGDFGLARRERSFSDRRSVMVRRTASGNAFLLNLKKSMGEAAAANGLVQRALRRSPQTTA